MKEYLLHLKILKTIGSMSAFQSVYSVCLDGMNNLQQVSNAILPRQIITLTFCNIFSSSTRNGKQLSSSSFVGLFSGGAQRADAVMYASINWSPSSIF